MPATTMRRTPWVAVDVDIRKDDRVVDLPGDTARYGYIAGVLAEARLQTTRGVFGSRATLEEAIGRFAGHIDDYLAAGLLERSPQLCTECRQRFGSVKAGAIVVHNWHRKQHDPTHAERQRRYRQSDGTGDAPSDAASDANGDGERDAASDGERDGQVTPYSRARAETPDTDTRHQTEDTRGDPPARAPARAATAKPSSRRRAGSPILSIEPDDRRYPVAKVLARRYRFKQVSPAQWDDLAEEVDNEYPSGTAKGRDPKAGWQPLATWLSKLPRDAGDPLEALFHRQQRVKAERQAAADADDAAWQETKRIHADEAGPIAAELAARIGNGQANGHAPTPSTRSRDSVMATLSASWPSLTDAARSQLLERYGAEYQITEAEVIAAVPRSIEEPSA